jgi:arylsulfatase I/J
MLVFTFALFGFLLATSAESLTRPSIIFILVDDWGFGNVGVHNPGNKNVVTPNIDRIISEGLLLNRSYVFKYCSPTRSALQTGRNPIHVNVLNSDITQHNPKDTYNGFQGAAANFTGIANKLKGVGYSTAQSGKWNAGMAYKKVTPMGRGYDSSLFYFDYDTYFWNETRLVCKPQGITTDLSTSYGQSLQPANMLNNTWECSQSDQSSQACPHGYQDEQFFSHVSDFITNSSKNPNIPFFLFWAPHAPHDPYEVPDEFLNKFDFIDQPERKFYSAMVNYLDTNFGKLEDLLKSTGLWNNTLVVVSSDK